MQPPVDPHDLIRLYGRDHGLERAAREGADQRLLDTLRRFYETEASDLGVAYAGFCILSLPHRQLKDPHARWHRHLRRPDFSCALSIEPGDLNIGGELVPMGVPYGAVARVIMLYLQKQAVMTGSREVELGATMYQWLQRLGVAVGGSDYKRAREQMLRISACTLRFTWGGTEAGRRMSAFKKDSIVESGLLFLDEVKGGHRQSSLWQEKVTLSPTFYDALCNHPVPVNLNAVRSVIRSSRALDIYIWLAYRLHALGKQTLVPWPALMEQFEPDYCNLRAFRQRFHQALELALCVYPEAKVETGERGLVLHPSPPPVGDRRMRLVGQMS